MPRSEVMRHMLLENMVIIIPKRVETKIPWRHCLCSEGIVEHVTVSLKTIDYVFPLFLYPDEEKDLFNHHQTEKEPNIPEDIFDGLEAAYGKRPSPEDIFYYIYGVLYSTIYRETYEEFLRIDFPRVPFTADVGMFTRMGELGKELADLHLLKSPVLENPIAKYMGGGENNRVEKITYDEDKGRIYINEEKYFEGITSEVWNYHIGGYQVLQKYLKDRKGRVMDDAPHYCRIVTALSKTIEIQERIDELYPDVEREVITL